MKQTNLNEIIESNVKSLQDLDVKSIEKVASEILEVRNNEGTLYIAGNGGSSSTASHFVNDLTKATRKKSNNLNIKATCLSDNTSLITAISNDISYDEIFKFQIDNNISTKDMLIVISASGNSENLIRAVDYCKNNKIKEFDPRASLSLNDVYLKLNLKEKSIQIETADPKIAAPKEEPKKEVPKAELKKKDLKTEKK